MGESSLSAGHRAELHIRNRQLELRTV